MAITLTNGATVLTLPADLTWPDEFAWTPVESTSRYSAAGSLLISRGVRQAGRPITLQGGANWGWMPRSTALTLLAWAAQPGAALSLSYRSITYAVKFAPLANPLEITPVVDYSDPLSADNYFATIRLIVTS